MAGDQAAVVELPRPDRFEATRPPGVAARQRMLRSARSARSACVIRFWKPDDPALGEAVGKLRAWVEQVYRPGYGHLAAGLGECWDRHPLCLYVLDWLSELWSVLYLAPRRTQAVLAGQAEWHARLLPAAADLLARETRSCPGHSGHGRSPWTEARP